MKMEPMSGTILPRLCRRSCLSVVALVALSSCLWGCVGPVEKAPVAPSTTADFAVGADISALGLFERKGTIYRRGDGRSGDAIRILREAGMNSFRLRLFVNPDWRDVVVNDTDYTIALAKRVKASGATLLLDIHYSDTWADPSKQFKPAAWENLSFEELQKQVEDYTRETLTRFVAAGVTPDYVQLGNEITNGMLWPDGHVEFAKRQDTAAWDRFAALQNAAFKGLSAAFAGRSMPQIVLHIESTGNLPRTEWFLSEAARTGIRYDVMGFSYYPQWHGSMDDLAATLALAARLGGKPVMVAETACPWKPVDTSGPDDKPIVWPANAEGQRQFARVLAKVARDVPGGACKGIYWWYPEAVPNPEINVWLGGGCALFDDSGRLLPSARELGRP
jgi:arabinogalactan endo-1,4-beta-galactosidase